MPIPKKGNRFRKATLAQYKNGDLTIKVTFPYFPDDVSNVKTIPGRQWHQKSRIWTVPLNILSVQKLEEFKFDIDPRLYKYARENTVDIREMDSHLVVPRLKLELYPYQKRGVSFIEEKNGRALKEVTTPKMM